MNLRRLFKHLEPVILILLALIFTISLMFASVELPQMLDSLLGKTVPSLAVATGQDALSDYKTELYLSYYNIRLIGYICLGIIAILIIAGFVLEKQALASMGAVFLFLPVFGHFAATMFFLGGLGFLRFLWLPFLDISFDIMRMGDIILLPYRWILNAANFVGINLYRELPFIITGLGIFLFLLGVLAWMYGRIRKQNVTDFWIYRISRHPQYLGWIIWSYGMLFLPGPNIKQYVGVANSLPWLLSTMIIIGVALLEERKMKRQFGESYQAFRERAPFLFPLPRIVRKFFSLPLWLIFRKDYPDRKREIASVISFYTAVALLLSAFSTGMISGSKDKTFSEKEIAGLVHTIKTATNRNDIRNSAATLAEIGGSAVDSLITLLNHDNVFVRWYCADALGMTKSEKAIQPLADLLDDPDHNVRKAAAGALGSIGSPKSIPILIAAFQDPNKGVESSAARSLGMLKAREAVPALVNGLEDANFAAVGWIAWALGEIGSKEAVEPLISRMEKDENLHYLAIGDALGKLGSDRAVDAYVKGLSKGPWWMQSGCAAALGEMRDEKGFEPLIETLRTGEARVRRAAVLAIAKYPVAQAEPVLQEALQDEDWEVQMYAKDALEKIKKSKEE